MHYLPTLLQQPAGVFRPRGLSTLCVGAQGRDAGEDVQIGDWGKLI